MKCFNTTKYRVKVKKKRPKEEHNLLIIVVCLFLFVISTGRISSVSVVSSSGGVYRIIEIQQAVEWWWWWLWRWKWNREREGKREKEIA